MLGDISAKYESGKLGYEAISKWSKDPGGASYGRYQLSFLTGTLTAFLRESGYEKMFEGLDVGSKLFDEKWVELARNDPKFREAQHEYIKRTKFEPISKHAYKDLKIPRCEAVDELLWSISVQHGRWAVILQRAMRKRDPQVMTHEEVIKRIMDERVLYVNNLKTIDGTVKAALNKRYKLELTDLLLLEAEHDHDD